MTPPCLPLFKRVALLALVATLAACGSKESRVESGLKKGAEFVSAGDWDKANVEVRNVLQIEPKNGRAYLIAAQASEGQRDPRKAYGQYLKAVELQPDLLDAKTGLARLLLLNGELPQAQGHIDQVLAANPKHAMARTLKGAILARQGQSDEAVAVVEQVLRDVSPVPSDARLLLAGLQANRKDWAKALATIDAGLKDDPRHTGLLQAAVEIAASNPGDAAIASQAAGFYKRAVQASPKNNELWLAWARHHQNRQETDLAESVMREAIKAQPDDGKRRLALADFLLATRGAAVAEQQYLSSIAERPRDMALRFGLANLYRGGNRMPEAQQVLQQIVDLSEDGPDVVAARTQLAQAALVAGKTDAASALLAEVLKANPRDNAALVLRSRIHLAQAQPGDAVADLRAALRDQPGSVELVQLLAQAHRMAKEPQLAREVLGDAIKAKPDDPTLRALVAADLADNADFKGAHAELDASIKALPQATRLYELKVQIALSQNDPVLAIKTLEQLKARQPQSALPYVRLGQLYTSQKKLDAALKEYDAGTAAAPSDPSAYIAAVTLLSSTKRHDEATARIQARMKAEPANMLHRQLAGELALNRRDFASAEREYRAVIAGSPNAASGYLGVAKVMGAKGDAEGALAALADGEKAVPSDRGLPMARAEWLTRLKRTDEAIAAYESLRTRFPDDDTVVNNLAYLLAEVKGDPASAERALSLASRFAQSRNPGHLDSLGWIHYRLGQYDKAVPLLERAVALAQPSPLLELHLGKALVKSGDTARGRALIQKAIDSKVNLPRLDEARALLAQG